MMSKDLSEKIRKSFTEAVVHTFRTMILVECSPIADFSESGERSYDYSGLIGFSGDLAGNCVLRMSIQTAREAVARLCGERVDDFSEISDGVGELVNIIAGNAKAALIDWKITLAFPEVIRGLGHEIGFHRYSGLIKLCFTSEIGDIAVVVAHSFPVKPNDP